MKQGARMLVLADAAPLESERRVDSELAAGGVVDPRDEVRSAAEGERAVDAILEKIARPEGDLEGAPFDRAPQVQDAPRRKLGDRLELEALASEITELALLIGRLAPPMPIEAVRPRHAEHLTEVGAGESVLQLRHVVE